MENTAPLHDKTALVTGGGRGIGRAVSLELARSGALVYVNYVSGAAPAEETVAEITAAGGRARAICFDVADSAAVTAAVKEIVKDLGGVDILVNNAGITRDGLLAMMKEEAWDAVLATNLKGAFNCTKAVARQMMKKRWGRVINISSVVGAAGNAGQANYAAAKAGLMGFTKSCARELAPRGVTVNCVAPGYIETDMTSGLSAEIKDKLLSEIPLGALGQPGDVAAAVAYLAGEGGRYVTGQCLHVNGGMYM